MKNDLAYIIGVSWPRSGHNLLVRLLSAYYGDRFGYCEFYKPKDCCKSVPCRRAGEINLSKNHDYHSKAPIINGEKYLIQYREFLPSVVSNFELFVRNTKKDSTDDFREFAEIEAVNYAIFMKRWAFAEAANATFVRISYDRLTTAPAETLAAVINQFSPREPIDRTRLAGSIETVQRITVHGGAEHIEPEKGVFARRSLSAFRHYDEGLFQSLDQRTRLVYNKISNLPLVSEISRPTSRAGTSIGRPRLGEVGVRDLYVDLTGMLEWSGISPTGIPRVEDFVARQAIADPDPSIRIILFDRRRNEYRSLNYAEILHLAAPVPTQPASNGGRLPHKRDLIREAFRIIKKYPNLTREFDHHWTARITKRQSVNLQYFVTKTFIRSYRRYQWALNWWRMRGQSAPGKIDPKNGIVLMPNSTIFGTFLSESLSTTTDRAYICHDLIPWMHPEYSSRRQSAQEFVSHLTLLIRSGVHALCTSDASRVMLASFVAKVGSTAGRVDQFPLPSILYQTAKSLGRLSRFQPERPFILYCSTIETRKNHLLLARIWKRANNNGVRLPRLVCAGRWGWGVDELRAYLKANPDIAQSIEFVGAVSDIELIDLYRSALFGVFPSYIEGWGFGASECLDFGSPVIVSTAPALQEAVRGLMPAIDPNDEEAWFAQIRLLSENAAEREALRKRIVDDYRPVTEQESWEAIKTALRSSG